jgi:AraC-like DNA-binding protein
MQHWWCRCSFSAEPRTQPSSWLRYGITDGGGATLRAAFQGSYGLSPKEFLRAQRLSQARRLLRASSQDETTVTQIAFGLGFWDLGRFAGQVDRHRPDRQHRERLRQSQPRPEADRPGRHRGAAEGPGRHRRRLHVLRGGPGQSRARPWPGPEVPPPARPDTRATCPTATSSSDLDCARCSSWDKEVFCPGT